MFVFIGIKVVDFVVLYFCVYCLGGYYKVIDWSSILEVLGFGFECGFGLKFVFVKYLKVLEIDKYIISFRLDVRSFELGEYLWS